MKKMIATCIGLAALSGSVHAGPNEQAQRMYSSLTGSTPNKAEVETYAALIKQGKKREAAKQIVDSNKGFYNVTLKDFFTPMFNEDGTTLDALNDGSALMICATRDEINFFDVFYKDLLCKAEGELITRRTPGVPQKFVSMYADTNDGLYFKNYNAAVRIYNRSKNDQYQQFEEQNLPLGDANIMVLGSQLPYATKEPSAVAGLFSTRAWAKAYYQAGTNRASFAFFAKNFLCKEMEELSDTSTPDFRVRRDVDRAPGGEPSTYKNFCVGCHAGQDALGGAFAYYDFKNGAMHYAVHEDVDPESGDIVEVGPIAPKVNLNNMFTDGHMVNSDRWFNLWNQGQNKYLGWGSATSGNGAKSLGKMLSETDQLRSCMSERVFEKVCFRKPASEAEKALVEESAKQFDKDGNMKNLFINLSIACMGE